MRTEGIDHLKTSKHPTGNRTRDLPSCGTVLAPLSCIKTVYLNRNIILYFANKCGEATLLSIHSTSTVSLQKRQFQHLASRQDFAQTDGRTTATCDSALFFYEPLPARGLCNRQIKSQLSAPRLRSDDTKYGLQYT
jgi:hypothetical protein